MRFLIVGLFILGFMYLVSAISAEEASEAKALMESNASCNSLSNSQLEHIGEYIMEQMHPGTGHEAMHDMMGFKEGTSEEEQFHINLAKAMYCGVNTSGGMMGSNTMNNMMRNMLGGNWQSTQSGMMPYYNQPNLFGWTLSDILVLVLLLGLIILVYLHIWNKIKQTKTKR